MNKLILVGNGSNFTGYIEPGKMTIEDLKKYAASNNIKFLDLT